MDTFIGGQPWKIKLYQMMQLLDSSKIRRLSLKRYKLGIKAELLKHKQAGNPVCTWRDGKVVWVEPKDIPLDREVSG